MSECSVCNEPLAPEAKSCAVCGTSVTMVTAASSPATVVSHAPTSVISPPPLVFATSAPSPSSNRLCPQCGQTYGLTHLDDYCACGAELMAGEDLRVDGEIVVAEAVVPTITPNAASPTAPRPAVTAPPPAGAVCLVVYSVDKQPLYYHELSTDVTIIGRSDSLRGDFPDIDLSNIVDAATARRISRKHALVLRSRESQQYTLRPLAKNTGTQLEKELAVDLQDYPLSDGMRLVLGGVVRIKFEVIK